ncbi:uncharacterized protein LOC129601724 [Paramacrobiotus metropolitanus]|uniref:uncharacterized protein LOC129601724 n=1 Tax=Paramacrobiotus metropolitanus TaxID=2943436 RepID=UPI0024459540|nr:uncharacterized protein LOC129601724 [Paramacrobiotus metropolitanus]
MDTVDEGVAVEDEADYLIMDPVDRCQPRRETSRRKPLKKVNGFAPSANVKDIWSSVASTSGVQCGTCRQMAVPGVIGWSIPMEAVDPELQDDIERDVVVPSTPAHEPPSPMEDDDHRPVIRTLRNRAIRSSSP